MSLSCVICPECENEFQVEEVMIGDIFPCTDCGLNLLVKEMNSQNSSVTVQLTETDAEDWGE